MENKRLVWGALCVLVGTFLFLGTPTAHMQPSNLLINPGFESGDLTPWSKYGGTVTIVGAPNPVHGGTFAAQQQDASSNSTKYLHQGTAVQAGNDYQFSAWVYVPDPNLVSVVYLRIAWYSSIPCGGSKGHVDSPHIDSIPAAHWQQLQGQATAPAGAVCAKLRLMMTPATGQDPTIYWDDAVLMAQNSSTDTPTPTPSPTSPPPTSTPTSTPYPDNIFLNEYLPAPHAGGSEYVELYNANAFA
ncbi:MAG: hypothetical protein GXP37_15295, partial [Chloroflexi bacterium]|nr:hypothetical protein [Chloroflexota bacterium]